MQFYISATALLLAIVPQVAAEGGFGQACVDGTISGYTLTAVCGGQDGSIDLTGIIGNKNGQMEVSHSTLNPPQ